MEVHRASTEAKPTFGDVRFFGYRGKADMAEQAGNDAIDFKRTLHAFRSCV